MTPIERQILKNQSTILTCLCELKEVSLESIKSIKYRTKETLEFFVESAKEDCCEMGEKKK